MDWKQDLLELKFSYLERTTPKAFADNGGRSMAVKPYDDYSVNSLTASIVDYFKYSGGKAERTGKATIRAIICKQVAEVKVDFSAPALTKETVEKNVQEIDSGIFLTVSSFQTFLHQWKPIKQKLEKSIASPQTRL